MGISFKVTIKRTGPCLPIYGLSLVKPLYFYVFYTGKIYFLIYLPNC